MAQVAVKIRELEFKSQKIELGIQETAVTLRN
jgi:hypothetical protein